MELEKLTSLLICPVCSGPLDKSGQMLSCTVCRGKYPIQDGIPQFTKNEKFYYGEVSREIMQAVLNTSKEISVVDSLRKKTKNNEWILNYALAKERCLLKLLVDMSGCKSVLDLGCGWGNLSLSLAEDVSEVVAADLTKLRLQFLVRRCAEMSIDNISCVCLGDYEKLPFNSSTFDLVVLNGVLEWVPESIGGHPRQAQKKYMAEVNRILKPQGQVFVGIENRFGYGYLLGRREDHTNLRYGALLPRWLANMYSLVKRHKPYRTYTYSRSGYIRLLRDGGFKKIKFYGVRPDYRNPELIANMDSREGVSAVLNRALVGSGKKAHLILCAVSKTKLGKEIFPSFMIVASSEDNVKSTLIETARQVLGNTANLVWIGQSLASGVIACIKTRHGDFVARIGINDMTRLRIKRNWETLRKLSGCKDRLFRRRIPSPIAEHVFLNGMIYFESFVPGIPASQFCQQNNHKYDLKKNKSFLENLHANSGYESTKKFPENTAIVKDLIRRLKEQFILTSMPLPSKKIIDFMLEHEDMKKMDTGQIHGDFAPFNLLLDKKTGNLEGVIDWDASENYAPTFVDYIHYKVWHAIIINKTCWNDEMKKIVMNLSSRNNSYGIYCITQAWWNNSLWAHVIYCIWYQTQFSQWENSKDRGEICSQIIKLVENKIDRNNLQRNRL